MVGDAAGPAVNILLINNHSLCNAGDHAILAETLRLLEERFPEARVGLVFNDTASARAGAQVAQVPHHSFSLWNNYRLHPRLAVALGIVRRSDMFAAIDNTVVLPGYTRADLATYVTLRNGLRLQANIDNLFDANYFVNADNNTNISPGSPRTLRVALLATF